MSHDVYPWGRIITVNSCTDNSCLLLKCTDNSGGGGGGGGLGGLSVDGASIVMSVGRQIRKLA